MHAVSKLASALALVLTATTAFAQQTPAEPDNRYRIQLAVDGVLVKGSQELERLMTGRPPAEQEAIQAEAIPLVNRGQTSQLIVTVTDPNGVSTTYTRGKRISYETFGCLSISSNSVLTVTTNPSSCTLPEYRRLFVVFNDQSGKPITYSEFVFKVR